MGFLVRRASPLVVTIMAVRLVTGEGIKKLPMPDASAQAEAMKSVREVYGADYGRARTPVDRAALAERLRKDAAQEKDDRVARFVMLRFARDIAANAADVATAMRAVDEMSAGYAIDAMPMRLDVLAAASNAASTPAEHKSLVEGALSVVRAAVPFPKILAASIA